MKTSKVYTISVYQSADGWRLRIKAKNGRIVADGGEAYVSRSNAERAAMSLATGFLVLTASSLGLKK